MAYIFVNQSEYDKIDNPTATKYRLKDVSIIDAMISEGELSGLLNECVSGFNRLLSNSTCCLYRCKGLTP